MKIDRIHDTSSLDNATAYIVHRTARLLRVHLQAELRNAGLDVTPAQWFILFRLWERPGQALSELADADLADYPNITRQVDGLIKRNLVQRQTDPSDKRRSLVSLTDQGQRAMEDAVPSIIATRKRTFAGFDEAEVEQLVRSLKKLQSNIT